MMTADIVSQLKRIADALELLVGKKTKPAMYEQIFGKIRPSFGVRRNEFADIVFSNRHLHPKDISSILKEKGILSKSTYWRDVRVLTWLATYTEE